MVLDRLSAPVVLAPLGGGPSTPELAAAVTEAGGLGFIAAAYLPASEVAARIESARGLTQGPLGVNVFVPGSGPAQPADYASYVERFRAWAQDAGAEVGEARWDDDDWDAKVELLTANPVEVTSFTFGCPSRELVDELHRAGSEAWVTVTSPDEATQAAAVGADVLVVQGAEAGGHRGSFVNSAELPLYGVLALLDLL